MNHSIILTMNHKMYTWIMFFNYNKDTWKKRLMSYEYDTSINNNETVFIEVIKLYLYCTIL